MAVIRHVAGLLLMSLASACVEAPDPEPNWLFLGEWIDIEGRGRTADETCNGTFDYLDRYAKALSWEFGLDEHLGVYHWYSDARYDAEEPCGDGRNPLACAGFNGTFSATIPVDHELVHMANLAVTASCPSMFEEGLAVYYSTGGETPSNGDLELFAQRFEAPDETLPRAEYDIAGRFAGLLVRRFGLDAVLEVCTITGYKPDSETLASAMISVLGASPQELLAELETDSQCPAWFIYQSRVLACGDASAARSAGVVDEGLLLRYQMGCNEETTAGPRKNSIWIIERIEFLHSGPHWVSMSDAQNKAPPVELVLAQCEPCGRVQSFMAGDAYGPLQIEAGTYWLEMRADEDFSGEFTLEFGWGG